MHISILFSKVRVLIGEILAILSLFICYFCCHSLKSGMVFATVFLMTGFLRITITERMKSSGTILISIVSATVMFLGVQICLDILPMTFSIAPWKLAGNMLCCFGILFVFLLLTGNIKISSAFAILFVMMLATANNYVVAFRGTPLRWGDFLSVSTAINVVDNYHFFADNLVVYGWLFASNYMFFLGSVKMENPRVSFGFRLLMGCAAVVCLFLVLQSSEHLSRGRWLDGQSQQNGFLLSFFAQAADADYEKPKGYDSVDFEMLEAQYSAANEEEEKPHIIVIMDEAFSDLRIYDGILSTNIDILPFYDSLQENTVKGYALSSVFGGSTANSEYEVLTGNTMAFMPDGAIAYQQFVQEDVYSLVTYLNSIGYQSVAMHPYQSNGWMRSTVWPYMGFQELYFVDSFPGKNLIRNYISDQEMFEKILDRLSDSKPDSPMFLFGVTMQNHGSYSYQGPNYTKTVELCGYSQEYPCAEQYLSLIRESDSALEYLITSLQELDERVVVVFFGDHQPMLETTLQTELLGSSITDLEQEQKNYIVPFMVWANYDIPEQWIELTSLNFLSNYLLMAAQLELPAYNQFLQEVEKTIPAMNALGYYSKTAGEFLRYEDASGKEKAMLELYGIVQYHSIFEDESRSEVFFPRTEE